MNKWRVEDDSFCESLIYGAPEYVNSFTSLIILFFGVFLLFLTKCNNALIRLVSASIAITGIGSFAFHWTLWTSTGLLDTVPMLVASYVASYLSMDLILYKYVKIDKKEIRIYEICSNILALITMCALYPAIMITAIDGSNNPTFDILFAIPNVIIIFSTLFMRFYTFKYYYNNIANNDLFSDVKRSFISVLIGLSSAAFGAILWFVTELNCDEYDWMKYTFAHGIWHIGMSYGYYQLMVFFIYMNALIRGKNPYYKVGDTKYKKYLYYFLPVVECQHIIEIQQLELIDVRD